MAALHEALKSLGPVKFAETPVDNLPSYLSPLFASGELIVDSVPVASSTDSSTPPTPATPGRSEGFAKIHVSSSNAQGPPPAPEVEALRKEWKPVKLSAKENPLNINVYKCSGKDGNGAWFARRSVHEGLSFDKWKRAFQNELPQSMKSEVMGEGNVRGIGAEKRLEEYDVEGLGKLEVYMLSVQFPGPTAARDFVTMFLTSDHALQTHSNNQEETPRHFMILSKPCDHPETQPRDGFVRGTYESVEFVREIRPQKKAVRSSSALDLPSKGKREMDLEHESSAGIGTSPNLGNSASECNVTTRDHRTRGMTISVDWTRHDDSEHGRVSQDDASYPVEWIMITRSDPGGSVPRFMVERGTPSSIVNDASRFLKWACEDEISEAGTGQVSNDAQPVQANGTGKDRNLSGPQQNVTTKDYVESPVPDEGLSQFSRPDEANDGGGIYGMVMGAATAAGNIISAHAPAILADNLPRAAPERADMESVSRPSSSSSDESFASSKSFESATEGYSDGESPKQGQDQANALDSKNRKKMSQKEKELAKLEERRRKIEEKYNLAKEKEINKKSEDSNKEAEHLRKATEKHERELRRQEERFKKEVEKLERKKHKEAAKAEARQRKAVEKDQKQQLLRELEEARAHIVVVKKENGLLKQQVGELQAENTVLAAKLGKLGPVGEDAMREYRESMMGFKANAAGGSASASRKRSGSWAIGMKSPRPGSLRSTDTASSEGAT